MTTVLGSSFMANPGVDLVPFERLESEVAETLVGLRDQSECFGVLIPKGQSGARTMKSVDRDTALAWYALREPGVAPRFLAEAREADGTPVIIRLVLDEVLAIMTPDGPLTGAGALRSLGIAASAEPWEASAIGRLSAAALQYAQRLPLEDKSQLSARLYFYNRRPLDPGWVRYSPDDVAECLGLPMGSSRTDLAGLAEQLGWVEQPAPEGVDSWRAFRRRTRRRHDRSRAASYKLYVSPVLECVREAVSAVMRAGQHHHTFKVPRDVATLFRPDKIVLYFDAEAALRETAQDLLRELSPVPAQPVPFTADLGGDGLLSWGMDPPRSERSLPWQEQESWRLWVTNRLASALIDARSRGGEIELEPWRYAVERLRVHGIDTSWIPRPELWDRA